MFTYTHFHSFFPNSSREIIYAHSTGASPYIGGGEAISEVRVIFKTKMRHSSLHWLVPQSQLERKCIICLIENIVLCSNGYHLGLGLLRCGNCSVTTIILYSVFCFFSLCIFVYACSTNVLVN